MKNNISSFNSSVDHKSMNKIYKILSQGNIIDGEEVLKFEQNFSQFLKKKNILAVSDLSSAIYLILKNLRLKKNDEVLSLSFNCLSSTSPIIKAGLKPLWCDFKKNYPAIDLEDCQKLITKKTKVLLLYYVGGYVQNPYDIKKFCKKNNLIFIEDVNCALGSSYKNKKLGSFGDYSVFSFYPNRTLSSINGGAISFPNKNKMIEFRDEINYGIRKKSNKIGNLTIDNNLNKIGFFNKFLNISACIANENLQKLNSKIIKIKKNKIYYDEQIKDTILVNKLKNFKDFDTVPWVYFLRSKKSKEIIKYLKRNNINSNKLHYTNHLYKGFRLLSKKNIKLKNTINFYKEVFTIPCGWWLTIEERNKIVKTLNSFNL